MNKWSLSFPFAPFASTIRKHNKWLRGGGVSATVALLVVALIFTATSRQHALASSNKAPTVQYVNANGLADPGFTASATAVCPSGTYLIAGSHILTAGATLHSEGISGAAWVVMVDAAGTTPVYFSSIATCLSMAAYPALQTVQGNINGTVTDEIWLTSFQLPFDYPPTALSLPITLTGAPGYAWSTPTIGTISVTATVPVSGYGSLTFTLTGTGTGVGQYNPATGSLVENVSLHGSTVAGDLDLQVTLTTGKSTAGSVSLTGHPVDAQGNITVVGVGTATGSGIIGEVFSGSTVALTFTGTVTGFPAS